MTDSLPAVGAVEARSHQRASPSYKTAQEAERHARATRPNDGPELKAAAQKIDRLLSSGRPLRHDVPRGFYLNVEV